MIQQFLNNATKQDWKGVKVVHHAVLPAREGIFGRLDNPLGETLCKALHQMGIRQLYSHQVLALESLRSRKNVVAATPTSSGKSMIYNLAVAEALLEDARQHALYLFPIKALSRDQLAALETFFQAMEGGLNFKTAVYDGDTTSYQRTKIRQHHPHILLTNPDMLHYALLPYHSRWEKFWRKLTFVVIDEMHSYRGIFGSHVAQIIRRLRRICRFYGSSPQFVLLSATIANPLELAVQLTGLQESTLDVVQEHGAPQAKRHFIFLQPEEGTGTQVSAVAARLLVQASQFGLKTIAFTQSRKLTELLHMSVMRMAPRLARRVSSYRAGFLPEERRSIERKLSSGELAAVISTSALEMGIDIGGLDLCILVGYPGTVMTTWQRGGRVGRSGRESAIMLLPQADALDQYIVQHPEQFLQSRYELAVTDPLNGEVLKAHLPCAACELPLELTEIEVQEPPIRKSVDHLTKEGVLLLTADGEQWISRSLRPHRDVDIRSVGSSYVILKISGDGQKIPLGKNDGIRALKECHPGAVYLHRGESYQVESLDLDRRVIHVTSNEVPYFTRVKSEKETEILEVLSSKPAGNFIIRLGRLRVTERITGYEKRRLFTQELLGFNPLDLPPHTFETVGFWVEIETILADHIRSAKLHFMGGIHAVEHATISMFPLFALCDRNDIGGIASPLHPQVGKSAVFIYDGYPGGIGLAARGFEIIMPLLEKTKELIASCPCSEGCPGCIHSPKCGAGNKPLDKQAALAVLKYLTGEWELTKPIEGGGTAPDQNSEEAFESFIEPAVATPIPSSRPRRRIGFFDLETQRLAQEVGGWQNKALMRVSVAVVWEVPADTFRIYREEDIPDLIRYFQQLDLVVGFNVARFDYEVLRAYTPFDFRRLPTFDLLDDIHQRLGIRLSLDHLAEKNLGKTKTADGIQAVKWFRESNWEPLIRYCKDDVLLTRDLFYIGIEKGYLLYSDRRGHTLRIPTPWDIEKLIQSLR